MTDDDLARQLADTEPVTVGALRQILGDALAPLHKRLDRLENEVLVVKADTTEMKIQMNVIERRLDRFETRLDQLEDSVSTIRSERGDGQKRQRPEIRERAPLRAS